MVRPSGDKQATDGGAALRAAKPLGIGASTVKRVKKVKEAKGVKPATAA